MHALDHIFADRLLELQAGAQLKQLGPVQAQHPLQEQVLHRRQQALGALEHLLELQEHRRPDQRSLLGSSSTSSGSSAGRRSTGAAAGAAPH